MCVDASGLDAEFNRRIAKFKLDILPTETEKAVIGDHVIHDPAGRMEVVEFFK